MSADYQCPTLFVTGTDTGVGKTTVTSGLARHFAASGLRVGVMKPIETGVVDPQQPGPDAELLRWAAQADDPDETIAPYRFRLPAAPAQAVEDTGTSIDIAHLKKLAVKLTQDKDLLLIEGAGGLMVPVQGGYLIADLIRDLDLPVLIITRPGLGTINHTLLTTFTAQNMGLHLAGFIINRMPKRPDPAATEAPHYLASLASADLPGVLPEVDGDHRQQVESLADEIGRLPTLHWLTRAFGLAASRP
ncbi:MAG: dethiobiotin synthase [Desulfuromonas sp.]|nr:MAG: dethiobiotin synthase [Desulfuromonas sp.]